MKRFYRIIVLGVALVLLVTSFTEARARRRTKRVSRAPSCRAILLSDATSGRELYSFNKNTSVFPASTAKVMTALLVMEKLSLDNYVRVNHSMESVQPSKIFIKPGEEYAVRDLLYAILLNSANDASVVLAEAVAGSEARFVAMMNRRARELGTKHTVFSNSHGLPSPGRTQQTTASDMYVIFRQALKFPFFKETITKKFATITSRGGRQIGLKSHNTILFNDWRRKIYGKTGYTRQAQGCFVGTMEDKGRTLVIGVFGCSRRWDKIESVVEKYGGLSL